MAGSKGTFHTSHSLPTAPAKLNHPPPSPHPPQPTTPPPTPPKRSGYTIIVEDHLGLKPLSFDSSLHHALDRYPNLNRSTNSAHIPTPTPPPHPPLHQTSPHGAELPALEEISLPSLPHLAVVQAATAPGLKPESERERRG